MKTFKYFVIGLTCFTIYFAVEQVSVGDLVRGATTNFLATIQLWLGGSIAQSPNRQLPQNQGDSEEYIQPIEELEEIE